MASLWSGLRLLLVSCLVLSTQSLLLIQGAFVLRQDYIAEKLCVNRDRPEMECDGHCVLKERMGEHHKHEDTSGTDALALALSVVPLLGTSTVPLGLLSEEPYEFGPPASSGVLEGHSEGVFRPPQAV